MTKPNLQQQAAAVARASANLHGHIDHLRERVNHRDPRKRRPPHELDMAEAWYPALLAAANTMAFMLKHEAKIREMIEAEK